ncbi:Annexin [Ancylostoma duodenale]|uniref:Annexin n=1 Tax=Ancylostoma duodenale TaxID=51022 RepID=A0A0C2CW09_9BILA|nr:Annexin [Ancylostoma duodenale]
MKRHFQRLLVSLCAGGRDESNFTDGLRANQDARKLYSAGERRLGTDESCFNQILASQNFNQLRLVFAEYEKVLFCFFVCFLSRTYILLNFHAGLGTRDNDLIRLVVSRCEYDMVDIRGQFQAMYKTSLENMIKGDCSGAYKDGLIALVNGN